MNKIQLRDLDRTAKIFLIFFLTTMLVGIFTGLGYIYYTTDMNTHGTIEHYKGSIVNEGEIPEEFPKSLEGMILTTHAHVNSFALISFAIGMVFYFGSIINGKLKIFILIEPFISTMITFISLWLLRYVNETFVYIVLLSGVLMYSFWIIMIIISIYELLLKK
tara:strand:- start:1713 stop:2201 length:489 start_codon:yes stop_codon:yes gene_type:complete